MKLIVISQSEKRISGAEIYRRVNNTDTKSIELYVSDQPDGNSNDWEKIGNGQFGGGNSISVLMPESINTEKGRCLKLLLPDNNRTPFTSVAEIYVYGK